MLAYKSRLFVLYSNALGFIICMLLTMCWLIGNTGGRLGEVKKTGASQQESEQNALRLQKGTLMTNSSGCVGDFRRKIVKRVALLSCVL